MEQLQFESRQETCEEHGSFLSRRIIDRIWTKCPECVETGRRAQDDADRLQLRDRLRSMSGLRGRFLNATFENFVATTHEQREVLAACRSYIQNLRRGQWPGLWLLGPPGVGKTHLGAAMINALIDTKTVGGYMTSCRDVVRLIRSTWRNEIDKTEAQVLQDLEAFPVLVLDEVGIGFGTESETLQLFEVIDRRYQMQRPVVVLSNKTAKEIRGVLGDRIFDRLREGARVLPCQWPSRRGG